MPSYLQNKSRDKLTFVQVRKNRPLYFGWNAKNITAETNVSEEDVVLLGHREPADMRTIAEAICIIGANAPKPVRATKIINRNPAPDQQGSVSTFCSGAYFARAQQGGWKLGASVRSFGLRQDSKITTVAAKVEGGGLFLVQKKSTAFVNQYASELGLILPGSLSESDLAKCFVGTSKPRPPRVQKDNAGSTFCSFDSLQNALQSGWQLVEAGMPYEMDDSVF